MRQLLYVAWKVWKYQLVIYQLLDPFSYGILLFKDPDIYESNSLYSYLILMNPIRFWYWLSIIGFTVVLFNYFYLIFFFVSLPADPNRVPYDLPEAESELIAGFITEHSTIYFSLILLTEYAGIIALTYLIILVFSIYPLPLVFIVYFICLIRSTLNRLKFDELMTSARLVILPIIFSFLLLSLFYIYSSLLSMDPLSYIILLD